MQHPTQTDRLQPGHIATFVWNTCTGKPVIGSYWVVESLALEGPRHDPPAASMSWLAPFMGKGVKHIAAVSAPEDNEMVMLLVSIDLPPEHGVFDTRGVTPNWFTSLDELWLERGLPPALRELLAA